MTHEDRLMAELNRIGKPVDRALERRYYGDPANHVKFESEKGRRMDRIKELLNEWAGYHHDGYGAGYPKQSPFASERVQNDNRSTETYRAMPAEIVKLNGEVERLAPGFKQILRLEYLDRRPQKTKAAILGIPREVFSVRLRFIHEQLNFVMFGGLK